MNDAQAPSREPPTWLFFLLVLLGSIAIQFSFDRAVGSDGFFHLRIAKSPFSGMPWMPGAIFDEGWVDHQLLFHILMAPFASLVPGIAAAKLSAAVFAALAITGLYIFLRHFRTPLPWLLALLPAASSWHFLARMEMPRTQSLSVLLLTLSLLALITGRSKLLFGLAWAYMATYHVGLGLLGVAFVFVLCKRHSEGRWDLAPLGLVAAGLSAGLLLHPHSPRTLSYAWDHVVLKVLNRSGLPVGGEWTESILSNPSNMTEAMLGPLLILAAAIFFFVRAEKRRSIEARFLLLLALAASLAALSSSKFVEYAAPLSTLALGLSLRDGPSQLLRRLGLIPTLLIAAILLGLVSHQGSRLRSSVLATEPSPERFARVADFLRSEAEPGERVYHFDWGDFPELVWHAPEYRYVVGLDPHFLALKDPEQWGFYERLSRCHYSNPSKVILERFGARWALISLPWEGAERCMAQDPGMELVLRSPGALLYRIATRR